MSDMVHRLAWHTGNTYVIEESGRFAIVDPGYPRYWRSIESAMRKLAPDALSLVDLVVVTHIHPDHCGGVDRAMAACPSARLASHPDTDRPAHDPLPRITAHHLAIGLEIALGVAKAGFPLPKMGFRSPLQVRLEDEMELPEPFGGWRALHTPGHVRAHVALHKEATGELVCGDVFVNTTGRPAPTGLISDPVAMSDTLARLSGMRIDALYPGHGEPALERAHERVDWSAVSGEQAHRADAQKVE